MENKRLDVLGEDELSAVSGGFLGFLSGCTEEPTPAAASRGLTAGMEFDTKRSCVTCGSTRYRVKDFYKDDSNLRVACCGCGSLGYWHYEILDAWWV